MQALRKSKESRPWNSQQPEVRNILYMTESKSPVFDQLYVICAPLGTTCISCCRVKSEAVYTEMLEDVTEPRSKKTAFVMELYDLKNYIAVVSTHNNQGIDLNKRQINAIESSNKYIIIKPADKGFATVVMSNTTQVSRQVVAYREITFVRNLTLHLTSDKRLSNIHYECTCHFAQWHHVQLRKTTMDKRSSKRTQQHETSINDATVDPAVAAALANQQQTFQTISDALLKTFQACLQACMDATNKRIDTFVRETITDIAELNASLQYTQKEVD